MLSPYRFKTSIAIAAVFAFAALASEPNQSPIPNPQSAIAKVEVTADGLSRKVAFSAKELYKHAEYLASDECEGRLPGSPGHEKARQYIIKRLRKAGFGEVRRFPFEFISGVKLGPLNALVATYDKPDAPGGAWFRAPSKSAPHRSEFLVNEDFRPLRVSRPTGVSAVSMPVAGFTSDPNDISVAQLVFAGYGISAPEHKYDDYKDIDARGKIVLVFRGEPETADGTRVGQPADPHHGGGARTFFSDPMYKASTARDKGALAVVLVNGKRGVSAAERATLIDFAHGGGRSGASLPIIQVFPEVAEDWLRSSGAGKDLISLQKSIDEKLTPRSFAVPGVTLRLFADVRREHATDENLAVVLPGTDCTLKHEIVVLGAHYDHLGRGNEFSLAAKKDMGKIHYGADDNASGCASLLELAEALHKNRSSLKRTVWIMFYGAEELGTLGSLHFTRHPPADFDMKQVSAMLNMDMVGRCRGKSLLVFGVGTGQGFDHLIREANEGLGLELKPTTDGFGASDQQSFVSNNIPVLFFFTGAHEDYHKPSDTVEKLNVNDQAAITALIYRSAATLIAAPERPKFVKLEIPKATGGGFNVVLGVIPDYAYTEKGMRLSVVRDGSAADKAGLKAGDVLIQMGLKKIENIHDYMFALQQSRAGVATPVKFLREGKEMDLLVTPQGR